MKKTGWKEQNGIFFRIIERELNDAAHLLVVDAVDDGGHRNDIDAVAVEILDGPQLHVEQIAHQPVRVSGIADAVELQVGVAETGGGSFLAQLRTLSELDSVSGPPARSGSRPCA